MAQSYPSFVKDPQAVLDYSIDWSSWLGSGETISASTWTVATGLTKGSDTKTDSTTTVWVSGGTAGAQYLATNHITTSAARQDDRSILIIVEEQ